MLLLALAGVGATAALGGLRQAPPEGPPQRRAGEEVDQDLFRTKVEGAVVRSMPTDPDDPDSPKESVLELSLKVYNEAMNSVPLQTLEDALLRVAPPQGEPLTDPPAGQGAAKWRHGGSIPGEGVPGRLLPPRRTSTVLLRFRGNAGPGAQPPPFPDVLDIDLGHYENHEDALTGRHWTQLVNGDDGMPEVVAHVTVPVRKAV